jgi:polysaccharide export outer membrane protein
MSYRWLLTAALVAANLSSSAARAQSELNSSPARTKSHEIRPAAFTSESAAESASVRLEAVKVQALPQGIEFEIKTSSAVKPVLTAIPDPNRLVIDFPNTVSAYPENHIAVDRDGVKAVRIGVQPVLPPVTRVVLDLERPRNYQMANQGNTVTLKLDDAIAADYAPPDPGAEKNQASSNFAKGSAGPNAASLIEVHGGADPTGSSNKTSLTHEVPTTAPSASSAANGSMEMAPAAGQTQPAAAKPVSAGISPAPPLLAPATPVGPKPTSAPAVKNDPPSDVKSRPASTQPLAPAAVPATSTANASTGTAQPASSEVASLRTDPDLSKPAMKPATAETPADQYVIGEQDVLAITVWKEPELSGVVVVRPDGIITVPLVNEVKVVGLTPEQLQALLTEKLKPFVNVPQVTVTVRQINSRNVYLIGQAAREGAFPINSSTTILQLIAQAGGLRDFAKRKGIYVIRKLGEKQIRYSFNYDDVIRGKNTKQNIVLQPGDLVVVP